MCYVMPGKGLTSVVSMQQTTSCRNYSWTRCFKNCKKNFSTGGKVMSKIKVASFLSLWDMV